MWLSECGLWNEVFLRRFFQAFFGSFSGVFRGFFGESGQATKIRVPSMTFSLPDGEHDRITRTTT